MIRNYGKTVAMGQNYNTLSRPCNSIVLDQGDYCAVLPLSQQNTCLWSSQDTQVQPKSMFNQVIIVSSSIKSKLFVIKLELFIENLVGSFC
jgi:hypothetical protein